MKTFLYLVVAIILSIVMLGLCEETKAQTTYCNKYGNGTRCESNEQVTECHRFGNGTRCETRDKGWAPTPIPSWPRDTVTECFKYGNGTRCETRSR